LQATNYQQTTTNYQQTTMKTDFVTVEIDLQKTPIELQKAIETKLKKQGEPLRWAITSVNLEQQSCTVEAVVTKS
jgi:hypothetical protein